MRPLGKRIAWVGVALTLTAAMAAGVGTTFAYFTTHAEAVGGHTINLGDYTEITETFTDRTKHVVIRNQATDAGQSIPVFIRVKAFSGSSNPLTYSEPDGLSNWTPAADGYYYYTLPVAPGEETTQLDVKVTFPENAAAGDSFNVVVVYESTPVLYDANGEPYADWSNILDNGNLTGGGDIE